MQLPTPHDAAVQIRHLRGLHKRSGAHQRQLKVVDGGRKAAAKCVRVACCLPLTFLSGLAS
jgi:hypothetical protein